MSRRLLASILLLLVPCVSTAQNALDFSPEEFSARRARVMESIGNQAIAVIQGAPDVDGFKIFRQSNTMYYLSGIETAHSYLVIDGRSGRSTLYMPHEDRAREGGEGNTLAAEDVDEVIRLTGVDNVYPIEYMTRHWVYQNLVRQPHPAIYTPFSPAERGTDSRDELLRYRANVSSDPWDVQPSREGAFIQLLRDRYPQFEIRDLSPILDEMRVVKSPAEIDLIRRASQIAGLGLLEAMRCTAPGRMEYQLEACARFVNQSNDARRDAYTAIVGGGWNSLMGHYFRNDDVLNDGEFILMDFSPEYHNYASDVTRMWPVSGTFSSEQLELYNFIVAYRSALLAECKPGVTVREVLDRAAATMRVYVDAQTYSKPEYREAVERALTSSSHMQHPVGLAVHDVGNYKATPLRVGEVFSVDAMFRVASEGMYVRIEDVVVITETGVENFTDFIPVLPEEIEAIMRETSILDTRPPVPASEIK